MHRIAASRVHSLSTGSFLCRSVSALKEAYGADAVTEAGLAILEQQFPAYSRPALKELLEAAGGDVSSALDSMSFLEAEHSNHRAATKPAKSQVYPQNACTQGLELLQQIYRIPPFSHSRVAGPAAQRLACMLSHQLADQSGFVQTW